MADTTSKRLQLLGAFPAPTDAQVKAAVDENMAANPEKYVGPQGPQGTAGQTPYIGGNGNWWIGDTDTGVPAAGSGGGGASVYIGDTQPTDGTLYWLDTSDSAVEVVSYNVTNNLTNATNDNAAATVNEGESYAAVITAADGYTLSSVTVTMGGVNITGTNYADGSIYIASVTGDIVITAEAVEVTEETTMYTITNNLVNVASDNALTSVEENSAYSATLTAADGYELDAVTVTMGGTDVTADVYADGVVNIAAVTGDVVIAAVGEAVGIYTVSVPITYHDYGMSCIKFSDDGSATTGSTTNGATAYSGLFSADTKVKICIAPAATKYGVFYAGCWDGAVDESTNKFKVIYAERIQTEDTYAQAGKEYVKEYTVRAGYALWLSVVNSSDTLTVMREDNGVTITEDWR